MVKEKNTVKQNKNKHIFWVLGVDLSFRILVWVVVPILLAIWLGKKVDHYYDMQYNVFFTCFISLAFIFIFVGLAKEGIRAQCMFEQMAAEDEGTDKVDKKENNN
jgi:uncharacterized protein YqhQ